MQAQATSAAVCPECGTRLDGGFSRGLGRCMICLLRVGFDDAEEPNEAPFSSVTDRLGNYRIERRDDGSLWELGRGAMGVTYRALDTSLRRAVALKLIDSEWVKRGAEARERFMREARTAASLRHPNIATVYHFGIREENGQCFCAMELVEGETLEMRVRRSGPLDALTTIDIALQVSSALAAAEKQGLVHRDLKPANLMLVAAAPDANDSSPGKAEKAETIVKVIDFGVAKALVEKPDAMGLTHGGFVGTPAFASPEQFTDAQVDVRSDIYSLGATLWYLLTGHRPFEGATIEQIRASQRSRALPIEQLKAAHVPSRLISLLVSMLALEPAARPNVRALTSQLQDCRAQILDRWKVGRRLAFAAGLAGLAATVLLLNRPRPPDASPGPPFEKSIAVLQFENRSPDKNDAYVASGVRNEIVTKLTQMRGLKVISRNLRTKSGGPPAELRELGRKLGATDFLGGSIQRTADSISIDLQLIEAPTGTRLWAQSYKRALAQASELEGEVAQSVADALKIKLAPAEAQRLRAAFTSNPRAHDLYLRAIALTAQADEKSHEQQIAMLREAVAEDPDYAEAWSALSQAYVHMGDAYRAPREILLPAREAAIKAVSLDDQLSDAHLVLGGIALTYDWNFPLAKREFERAIALDPNSAVAHRIYGWYLARAERNYVAARQEMATARRLDPLNTWPWWGESGVAIAQGDYEGALRLAERVMEIDPEFLYDEDPIAHVYVAMGRWKDALRRYQSIPASRFNRPNFELAICYAHTDQVARARVILVELEKLAQERYVDHTHLAAIHAALGDKDKAFAALDQALNDRSARVYAPRFYPWLAPLREDSRFVELENKIARSQLPQSAEVASRPFEKSIAVLPFRNLSEDKENAFFADGIQDDLVTSLARIKDLKVVSRGSVASYRDLSGRRLRAIAQELGVGAVLEGSVRRTANRVLVNAQLTDATTERQIWSDRYDRTLQDSIALQGELAAEIATALAAKLSPEEKAQVEAKLTNNPDAYVVYLRGREFQMRPEVSRDNFVAAEQCYRHAVALDPRFALANARLAEILEGRYGWFDHQPALLAEARSYAEEALRLDPHCGQAHMEMARILAFSVKSIERDEAMKQEVDSALRLVPNDGYLVMIAALFQTDMEWLEEAEATFQRAIEINPREPKVFYNYAGLQLKKRDVAKARWASDRSLELAPESVYFRLFRAIAEFEWTGEVARTKKFLAEIPAGKDPDGRVTAAHCTVALYERNFSEALRLLAACPSERLPWFDGGFGSMVPKGFLEGWIHFYAGNKERAYTVIDSVRWILEMEAKENPGDQQAHLHVAFAYAVMGWKDAALAEIARAKEKPDGFMMAALYAHAGDRDTALHLLEQVPAERENNYYDLRLGPHWDLLRSDARFEKMLASSAPKTAR